MNPVNGQVSLADLMPASRAEGLPAVIDGLDLLQLRARLGGSDEVMQAVLRQFLQDFGAWREHFDLAQRAQNTDAMVRLAHTLKGTAASVCANQVQAVALALEAALRQGSGQTAGLLQHCDLALQQVLTVLRQQLPPEETPESAPMAPAQALQIVQEVMSLLQRHRHVPHSLLQELRAVVAPVASAEQLETLLRQLATFDFRNAQQTMADLQARMPA